MQPSHTDTHSNTHSSQPLEPQCDQVATDTTKEYDSRGNEVRECCSLVWESKGWLFVYHLPDNSNSQQSCFNCMKYNLQPHNMKLFYYTIVF